MSNIISNIISTNITNALQKPYTQLYIQAKTFSLGGKESRFNSIFNVKTPPLNYEVKMPYTSAQKGFTENSSISKNSLTDNPFQLRRTGQQASDVQSIAVNESNATWQAPFAKFTNVTPESIVKRVTGLAALSAASLTGIPQVAQVGQSLIENTANPEQSPLRAYNTGPIKSYKKIPGVKYADFRSRLWSDAASGGASLRLDGVGAATRGSVRAGIYAAAAASPVGAYSVFNLNGAGNSGYGWGDHDNPYALRKDFTALSHIATRWSPALPAVDLGPFSFKGKPGEWLPTRNPLEVATPFRGDKVTAIDFSKRKLADAYKWNDRRIGALSVGAFRANLTQDFIKFFFTGPSLDGTDRTNTKVDDIIVFRATLLSITDTHSPEWTPQKMIGRADPNYHYGGYSRNVSFDFDVYATSRDEMKPIYRKLNALVGYTAPTYNKTDIAMEAPWMRFTMGDLFYQTPAVMTACTVTLGSDDSPWETNITKDPEMMELPMKFNVSVTLNILTNAVPQKGGRFYTLAKQLNDTGETKNGNDNWLSDFKVNADIVPPPPEQSSTTQE